MARFGIVGKNRLGVSVPDLRRIARETGKDHELALELWDTGIPDAMILASMVDRPEEVTEAQMEAWVKDFASWDVCDQVCMNLFEKAPPVLKKIFQWAARWIASDALRELEGQAVRRRVKTRARTRGGS